MRRSDDIQAVVERHLARQRRRRLLIGVGVILLWVLLIAIFTGLAQHDG